MCASIFISKDGIFILACLSLLMKLNILVSYSSHFVNFLLLLSTLPMDLSLSLIDLRSALTFFHRSYKICFLGLLSLNFILLFCHIKDSKLYLARIYQSFSSCHLLLTVW
jgi:hypothetical protein